MTAISSDQLNDQADTLRSLNGSGTNAVELSAGKEKPAWVLTVTSGKGGVGKTAVVSNMAVALGRQGKRVLIIDADLGLANVDVVFGLAPQYNLNHFFAGEQPLSAILVDGPPGVKILPAGSGVQQFTRLDSHQKMRFMEELGALHDVFDVVLIDTEAGISDNVTYFSIAAQEILVVTAPEPTAITDAYALMKLLSTQYQEKKFNLVVNSVRNQDEALEVFSKLTMVAGRYLDISINFWGGIPYDRKMHDSVRKQTAMVDLYPDTKTSAAFEALAATLIAEPHIPTAKGGLQFFWNNLFAFSNGTS